MSRIGKMPVEIPAEVSVIKDGQLLTVKGPLGELKQELHPEMIINVEEKEVIVTRPSDSKKHASLHGLTRSLINNMVIGVSKGYRKDLEIVGVGYRAAKEGKKLTLNLGYSHPIYLNDPDGIETVVESNTKLFVKGIDKQAVGAHAAKIRSFREPEPYKGKGVKYATEHIRRKEGKTGAKA